MKLQRVSAILLTSVAFSAGFIGCGGDDSDDGAGGGSSSSTTSSSSSSSGASVSTGSNTPGAEYLGSRCTEDADCGPDGECWLESDPNGGPSGGYCTMSCTNDGD